MISDLKIYVVAAAVSSAAILSPGGIVIVCHDLGELLQLGVAPGLRVSPNKMHAQHTVNSASAVWRVVLRDVGHEILETHLTVAHDSSIPELLTCVLTRLRGTCNLTLLVPCPIINQFLKG